MTKPNEEASELNLQDLLLAYPEDEGEVPDWDESSSSSICSGSFSISSPAMSPASGNEKQQLLMFRQDVVTNATSVIPLLDLSIDEEDEDNDTDEDDVDVSVDDINISFLQEQVKLDERESIILASMKERLRQETTRMKRRRSSLRSLQNKKYPGRSLSDVSACSSSSSTLLYPIPEHEDSPENQAAGELVESSSPSSSSFLIDTLDEFLSSNQYLIARRLLVIVFFMVALLLVGFQCLDLDHSRTQAAPSSDDVSILFEPEPAVLVEHSHQQVIEEQVVLDQEAMDKFVAGLFQATLPEHCCSLNDQDHEEMIAPSAQADVAPSKEKDEDEPLRNFSPSFRAGGSSIQTMMSRMVLVQEESPASALHLLHLSFL